MKTGRPWGSPRTRRPVDRLAVQLETISDPSPDSAACTIVTRSRLKMNKSCLLDQVAISRFWHSACSCVNFPTGLQQIGRVEFQRKVRARSEIDGSMAYSHSFDEEQPLRRLDQKTPQKISRAAMVHCRKWPNGLHETHKSLSADQLVTLREGAGRVANNGWSRN